MVQLNGGQRYSFGLFVTAMALVAWMMLAASCNDKQIILPPPPAPIIKDSTATTDTSSAPTYSYLALGDSYTIGQGVPEAARFPLQVADLLTAMKKPVGKPTIIAQTGWPTTSLLSAIETVKPSADYDIVSLLIGVNDQYQRHDTTGYRSLFTSCLQKAIQLAAGNKDHVFVLSIPDYSVTPFGAGPYAAQTAKEIDQFNAINKSVTISFAVSYTDVTTISREVKGDPSMIVADGLHPSGSQYRLWAQLLAIPIAQQLK